MNNEKEIKNKPLTVEELKDLQEGDWVWTIYIRTNLKQYHCIAKQEGNRLLVRDNVCCLDIVGLDYSDYGTKWVAYKNKEEAENAGYGNVKQAIEKITNKLISLYKNDENDKTSYKTPCAVVIQNIKDIREEIMKEFC